MLARYSSELHQQAVKSFELQEMLRKAIENDCEGFFLNYQPLIRSDGQSVFGAEALLRFSCPELDMPFVSPGEFIPVLEKNGMINEVGAWAIRTALKQAAEWRKIDHTFVASIGKNRMDEAIIEYLMQLCHHTNINVCGRHRDAGDPVHRSKVPPPAFTGVLFLQASFYRGFCGYVHWQGRLTRPVLLVGKGSSRIREDL